MNVWFVIGAINGALAVAFGAFGTHGLQGRIDAHALSIYETGARYHMYHAVAICIAALSMRGAATQYAAYASAFFLVGILLFSGSLYILALTGARAVAIVTPFGGVTFLLGWITLAYAGTRLA